MSPSSPVQSTDPPRNIRTRLVEGLGAVLLAFGLVGVFVPILPTTPFVLAAAFCFSSNPKIYARIRDSPYFGEYIRAYREGGEVSARTRARALALTWAVLLVSVALLQQPWLRAMLVVVGVCVTVHLLTLGKVHIRGRGGS